MYSVSYFFFSSRRRHTRWPRDWSSDVCSSDLYEVSNFARPGHESRHNQAYWSGEPYLGLGPSAHSFLPPLRRWNLRGWEAYRRTVAEDRKSTRLNSSHVAISNAVFCLNKKIYAVLWIVW